MSDYVRVDKSNQTYISDKSFGDYNEIKLLNYLNCVLYPNDKFNMFKNEHSTMDFINGKIIAELKSRRNRYNQYPDTMCGLNKINQAKASAEKGKDIKYKFYFLFTDGLYCWDYKEGEYSIRMGGRVDRGSNERKRYAYVDIKYLKLITTDINSHQ
jgi:hypothetical protein